MSSTKKGSELLKVSDVCIQLSISRCTLDRLMKSPDAAPKGFKLGGQWRFTQAEVDSWIARQVERGAK